MTQTYTPTPPATSATSGSLGRAPLAVWGLATVLALTFVLFVGTNAPYADEWEFVPALVGDEPARPWLWKQHNEHRLPLTRAVYYALFTLTHDFRAGMFVQIALLSALALGLIRLAARLRGHAHWADCFFPISLLHIGHWENFVMGYQICFVLVAVFATALAVVAMFTTRENAFRSGVIAGVLLMLIALTGGSGLPVVPAVAVWIAFLAVHVWRSGSKGRALLLLLLVALPLVYLRLYFDGYHKPADHPAPTYDPLRVAPVAAQALSVAFGIGVREVWWLVFPGVFALGVATLVLLLRKWNDPDRRLAITGLIAVAAGVTGIALAIGIGRGGWPPEDQMGLWSRYAILVWPLLAIAYLVWVRASADLATCRGEAPLHGRSRWIPIGMCVAAALLFPANTGEGMVNGAKIWRDYGAMEAMARSGMSAEQIVRSEVFAKSHQCEQSERAERAIPLLRRERIGIFAR